MKIAIAGKGGTGKTTVAGILARTIASRGRSVWAIDADSNPNLAQTLGVPAASRVEVKPLPRTVLEERRDDDGAVRLVLGMPPADVARRFGASLPGGLTLLVMGGVDHAGAG